MSDPENKSYNPGFFAAALRLAGVPADEIPIALDDLGVKPEPVTPAPPRPIPAIHQPMFVMPAPAMITTVQVEKVNTPGGCGRCGKKKDQP
jgi:hypothetical protein